METVYFILGIAILLLVTADVFSTTLWVDGGAGPISSRLGKGIWTAMKKVIGTRSRILSLAGPLILSLTLLCWILLLWLGWLLLFAGDAQSIVDTRDSQPIDWVERIYFTGFTVFTLGTGDYVPREGFWQIATAVAAGNGMLFITMGVTYVLSILNAVTQQRSFASSITGVGKSGNALVLKAWNGRDFHNIDLLLNSVSSQLSMLASQHKAYPILHYYHSMETAKSAVIGVTILDEAMTILESGIQEDHRPNELLIEETRSSISDYLSAVPPNIDGSDGKIPPEPNLTYLQERGLPTVQKSVFDAEVEKFENRRRKLFALVEMDARPWPDGKED